MRGTGTGRRPGCARRAEGNDPRRLRRVAALLAIAATAGVLAPVPASSAETPPNIVLVLLDDLDQWTVQRIIDRDGGLHPGHFPTLATLADRGVFGRNVYANATACCPSRATLLLGTFSSENKIWSSADGEYYEPDPFAEEPPIGGGYREFFRRDHESQTIAVELNPAYRTIGAGKYLNGYKAALLPPAAQGGSCGDGLARLRTPPGWNAWYGLMRGPGSPSNGYSAYDANVNGCVVSRTGEDPELFLRDLVSFSIAQIHASWRREQPFFLYLSPHNVHSVASPVEDRSREWVDPEKRAHFANVRYYYRCGDDPIEDDADAFFDGSPNDCTDLYSFNEADKPGGVTDKAVWVSEAQARRSFTKIDRTFRNRLAALESLDEQLGRVITALERRDLLDETVIFVTSDQGFKINEHGLRFGKNTPYEEDIQIPFIAAGPGIVPTRKFAPIVSMVDLHATIEDLAGLSPDGSGTSFLPALRGEPFTGRDYVFVEGVRGGSSDIPKMGKTMYKFQLIRSRDQKFIWTRTIAPDGGMESGSDHYEIYDLIADPRELNARTPTAAEVALFTGVIARCASGSCPSSLTG